MFLFLPLPLLLLFLLASRLRVHQPRHEVQGFGVDGIEEFGQIGQEVNVLFVLGLKESVHSFEEGELGHYFSQDLLENCRVVYDSLEVGMDEFDGQ